MTQKQFLNYLILGTLSFAGGIVYATVSPLRPESVTPLWIGVGLSLPAVYFLHRAFRDQPKLWRLILILVLVGLGFALGWGRYSTSLGTFRENHISEFTVSDWSRTATIVGTVVDQPTVNRTDAQVVVEPEKIWPTRETKEPVAVSSGYLILQVERGNRDLSLGYRQVADNDIYGDRVRITGALTKLMPRKNPGTFSYRRYLGNKGIYGAVWGPDELERVEPRPGNPVVAWSLDLQTELLKVVKKTMPYPYSAFLGGSTLGLRGGLEYTETPFGEGERLISEEFKAAGTFHVLAVSGLHVGVIAAALLAIFAGLRVPAEFYAPVILGALLVFTIITGARPATIRAAIMTGLVVIGLAYLKQGLKDAVLFGLMLAALFILLYRPRLIYEASFTLSFSAVFCLALLTGPIEAVMEHIRDLTFLLFWVFVGVTTVVWLNAWNGFFNPEIYLPYFLSWAVVFFVSYRFDQVRSLLGGFGFARIPTAVSGFIAAQFAIQLGMMWPLSAYYFLKFPLAGGYANLLAIPLLGVVVPLGLLAELIGLLPVVGDWLALVLNAGNYLAVVGFMWISHVFAKYFPYPAVRTFDLVHLITLYAGLSLLAWWRTYYRFTRRCWYWITDNVLYRLTVRPPVIFASLIGLGAVALLGFSYQSSDSLKSVRMTVLDVGYGSAIAVQAPGKNNILINSGRRVWDWHNKGNLADRQDLGEMTVAPFFLNQRIKNLDLAVAQSPEPQYIGGYPYVLKHFEIDRVLGPLAKLKFRPLSMGTYLDALDNDYYRNQSDQSWFRRDYYGSWKRFWKPIRERGIPYGQPSRGRIVYESAVSLPDRNRALRLELKVLHPPGRTNYDRYASSNRSLVLSLRIGENLSVLFPGDIRKSAQQDIVESYPSGELQHDVMMAPSNGTQTSSVRESFVRAVDPEYLVFSTGYPDIKGPLDRKLQSQLRTNWESAQSLVPEDALYRTDEDYAIIFTTKGERFSVETFAGRADQNETGGLFR